MWILKKISASKQIKWLIKSLKLVISALNWTYCEDNIMINLHVPDTFHYLLLNTFHATEDTHQLKDKYSPANKPNILSVYKVL